MEINYKHLLGESVLFILNDGVDVLLKVQGETTLYIKGYDEEGLNRSIKKETIMDYVVTN